MINELHQIIIAYQDGEGIMLDKARCAIVAKEILFMQSDIDKLGIVKAELGRLNPDLQMLREKIGMEK